MYNERLACTFRKAYMDGKKDSFPDDREFTYDTRSKRFVSIENLRRNNGKIRAKEIKSCKTIRKDTAIRAIHN